MGGTYTGARAKARTRGKPRGSRGKQPHRKSKKGENDRPGLSTATASAGKGGSTEWGGSGRSIGGPFRCRSLGRRRRLGQRSSQRVGTRRDETARPPPLFEQLSERKRTVRGRLGDDHHVRTGREQLRASTKGLAKQAFGSVAADGVAEFACHRNPQTGWTVVTAGGQEHDAARKCDAGPGFLNRQVLSALAKPLRLRKSMRCASAQRPCCCPGLLLVGRHGETPAPLAPPVGEHFGAARRLHASAEAMFTPATRVVGLVRPLHRGPRRDHIPSTSSRSALLANAGRSEKLDVGTPPILL